MRLNCELRGLEWSTERIFKKLSVVCCWHCSLVIPTDISLNKVCISYFSVGKQAHMPMRLNSFLKKYT